MQTRAVATANIALALLLAAPGAFAQGKGGKARLVICHAPPGNPDARRTMEIPEPAWAGHEAHGDTLGPCDGTADRHQRGYGGDDERTRPADERKRRDREGEISDEPDRDRRRDREGEISEDPDRERRRDREREISDEPDGDDETGGEAGEIDRTRERKRVDRRDADDDAEATEEPDTSEARRPRRATRRDAGATDQPAVGTDGRAAGESGASDDAGGVEQGGAAAQSDAAPPSERGFFRGIQQFFGFGKDEAED